MCFTQCTIPCVCKTQNSYYGALYLNPTAVTEEVGLSEPVNVSLMTSGGSLAMLNMVALTRKLKDKI